MRVNRATSSPINGLIENAVIEVCFNSFPACHVKCRLLYLLKLYTRLPDKSAQLKIIFLISQPKQMLKLIDKKIIAILRKLFLLNWPYGILQIIWTQKAQIGL